MTLGDEEGFHVTTILRDVNAVALTLVGGSGTVINKSVENYEYIKV